MTTPCVVARPLRLSSVAAGLVLRDPCAVTVTADDLSPFMSGTNFALSINAESTLACNSLVDLELIVVTTPDASTSLGTLIMYLTFKPFALVVGVVVVVVLVVVVASLVQSTWLNELGLSST